MVAVTLAGGVGVWSRARPAETRVGTHPGGVRPGVALASFHPASGNSIVAFSSGCFWGSENAFRKMPGIVATAVGYSGGSAPALTESIAHATGAMETVLVEFNPHRTPFEHVLDTFWSLPRSTQPSSAGKAKAAIWTYNAGELRQARASLAAMEKKIRRPLSVQVEPARPFYLAEDFHQQYDEKAGVESCPATP